MFTKVSPVLPEIRPRSRVCIYEESRPINTLKNRSRPFSHHRNRCTSFTHRCYAWDKEAFSCCCIAVFIR